MINAKNPSMEEHPHFGSDSKTFKQFRESLKQFIREQNRNIHSTGLLNRSPAPATPHLHTTNGSVIHVNSRTSTPAIKRTNPPTPLSRPLFSHFQRTSSISSHHSHTAPSQDLRNTYRTQKHLKNGRFEGSVNLKKVGQISPNSPSPGRITPKLPFKMHEESNNLSQGSRSILNERNFGVASGDFSDPENPENSLQMAEEGVKARRVTVANHKFSRITTLSHNEPLDRRKGSWNPGQPQGSHKKPRTSDMISRNSGMSLGDQKGQKTDQSYFQTIQSWLIRLAKQFCGEAKQVVRELSEGARGEVVVARYRRMWNLVVSVSKLLRLYKWLVTTTLNFSEKSMTGAQLAEMVRCFGKVLEASGKNLGKLANFGGFGGNGRVDLVLEATTVLYGRFLVQVCGILSLSRLVKRDVGGRANELFYLYQEGEGTRKKVKKASKTHSKAQNAFLLFFKFFNFLNFDRILGFHCC